MLIFNKSNSRVFNFLLKVLALKDKTGVYIAKNSKITSHTVIEDGSRINGKIIIKGKGSVHIGKYCAIGDDVKIISSNHNIDSINLQYALQKKLGIKVAESARIDVNIGHNAWIGDSVILLPGVTVGNGAIIAAGSVVTKNVQAYSVSGGVPSRLLKFRFEKEKIDEIEDTQWWNWSIDEMKKNISFFKSTI